MMPRLKAEEGLSQIPILRVGTGNTKRGAATSYVRQLRRQATRGQRRERPKQASPERLRSVGIAVKQ